MARVTFGAQQRQPRQRTRLQPQRQRQERRNWYEDPGQILGWVRLAEALAAPKGLIARGVRAAQRWQLASAAEDRKEEALAAKREAEEVDAMIHGGFPEGSNEAMIAREEARIREARGEAAAQNFRDWNEPMRGPRTGPYGRSVPLPDYALSQPEAPVQGRLPAGEISGEGLIPRWTQGFGPMAQEQAPVAMGTTAFPEPEPVSRTDQAQMRPLLRSMTPDMSDMGGMERAREHLGDYFPEYISILEKRLKREEETGDPMMIPDWFREPQAQPSTRQEAGMAPEAGPQRSPFPSFGREEAAARYRSARRSQDEAQAAKAKEIEDYAADMSLSTVNEVYEDFGKYAGAKGGRLDADDFADLWEQAKLMLERDPSYVDGLALDPVGTQRRLLSDTMAYFKFLNMGGDPAAAKRQQVKDETAEVNLRRAKRREAQEKARDERKSRTGVRIVRDIPVGAPNWEDDLVQWGIWRDAGFDQRPGMSNVPSYLSHKDGGKYAAAANRAKEHLKDWLESPQGWDKPESQWSTWQRDAFKDESKEINKYRTQVDARDRTAGEEPSYDQASDKFKWTEEGGRKRTGTLSDVLKGRILTETEAKHALRMGGLSDAQADAAIEEANKAKKPKTTQRTKNAWAVIQDFSVADLQGNKSDVEARLDTGFLTRNKWDRLTDPKTQTKIREAISEILAAEEVEDVPQNWINIANKIKALGIRGL